MTEIKTRTKAKAADAGIGHNSGDDEDVTTEADSMVVAAGQLRAFIERVERLEEEKATIAEDIKEVYAEMKGGGWDVKTVRLIVRLRKMDAAERQEAEAMRDLYMTALGMA